MKTMKHLLTLKKAMLFPAAVVLVLALIAGVTESMAGPYPEPVHDHHGHEADYKEDMGKAPWVLNIEEATLENDYYRKTRWTGGKMQMVLMSLKPGEEIDLEVHPGIDQFIRIEQGEARVRMGESSDNLYFDEHVTDDWAIFIPDGYWHHVENTGDTELKLYTIYTPAEHPAGTVNETYQDAVEYHEEHHDHDHDHDHDHHHE